MAMASTCQDDDPRQSSAALCISFELLEESFGPEFTHQCFPGEWIRGYLPKNTHEKMHERLQHSTHSHHEKATHELQIQVQLSPSCRQCQVNAQVQRKLREIVTRVSKRPRLMNNKEDTLGADTDAVASDIGDEEDEQVSRDEVTSPDEKEEDPDFLLTEEEEAGEEPNDNAANAGTTRTRRMPVDEIIERCGKALPTMVQNLNKDDFLKEPIGTILHSYQRSNLQFVISVADGCNAVQYHNQVQSLATWFIETADSVHVASQDGGYWKVIYLFRRNTPHQYSLAGYLTIFHFLCPFKRPKSGIVARVCQALILPPYQRMGHGKMLLRTVHELASDSSNNIVEINVEDPAPAFVALRNCVDYELFQESSSTKYPWLDSIYTIRDVRHVDFFRGVPDKDAIAAGAVARITPRQVQICHDLHKLSLLNNFEKEEELTRQYRIMVKKRLAKVHREDLGACRSKEEKQALLGKIFDETLEQYKSVLKCQ